MPSLLRRLVLSLMLVGVSGCASPGGESKPASAQAAANALSQQRLMLSESYSMLYRDAGNLDLAELILYVKAESDAVDEMVTAVAKFGGELKKDLERIAKGRARYFAPVVGHGGREYERTVLIGFANGINHERHLCQVMAEAETDTGLKKFLLDTQKRYDGLHQRVNALLAKAYFKDPNGQSRN